MDNESKSVDGDSLKGTKTLLDDVGRSVTIPTNVTRVSPSGPLAQIMLYSLDSNLLASIAKHLSDDQKKYLSLPKNIPETGQLFGGKKILMIKKGSLIEQKVEAIKKLNKEKPIDVILDIGEKKENLREDLESAQKCAGVLHAWYYCYDVGLGS